MRGAWRCALAALVAAIATRAGASGEDWPFPGGETTYVAVRLGPVIPLGTFASGAVGIGGGVAGGAWWREVIGLELAVGVSWTSGRHAGAPSGIDDALLAYGVSASAKLAPWRLGGPYAFAGYGRDSFTFTERAGGSETGSSDGDYEAPHVGIGYLRRVSRFAVALAEVRYQAAHAQILGARRDLSAVQLAIGLAYP